MERKIIEIVWKDAVTDEGSFTDEERDAVHPLEVTSVGTFWFENDKILVLARDTFGDGNYRGILTIPIELIVERREIK